MHRTITLVIAITLAALAAVIALATPISNTADSLREANGE